MKRLTVPAPAKLNLSLDIVGVREDGYHLLRMIMQTVDLYDTLELELANEITLTCNLPGLPCDERNLAVKAARAFFERTGLPGGVRMTLDKTIPHGAGMGGGSADAAAVLKGLNELCGAGLSQQELCEIGLRLGADVPFCIVGGTQLAEGVGERLTPLPPLPDCFLLVAKPEQGVSTPEAYRAYDRLTGVLHPDTAELTGLLSRGDLSGFCARMENVLEPAVSLPEVQQIREEMLASGALGSRMTGSGSAVFGVFSQEGAALACKNNLEKRFSQVYLCHPCKN